MSLRQDDQNRFAGVQSPRCSQWSRWLRRVALIGVVLALLPALARAEDTPESEQLLRRMDVLLELSAEQTLTEEQKAELSDLLDRYTTALEREGQAKPAAGETPVPAPTGAPSTDKQPPVTPPSATSPPGATPDGAPGATPTPRRRTRATPAPVDAAPGATPVPTAAPAVPVDGAAAPTATPRPSRRNRRNADGQPQTPEGTPPTPHDGTAAPATPGVTVEPTFNVDAENLLKPFREREYRFSMKDVTYKDLVEAFARMASLPVVGDAPQGTASLVSSEVMDFETALSRVQMLLFKHPELYWIDLTDQNILELVRVADLKRSKLLPLDHIFSTLAAYRAANLRPNQLALLLYTPETGSVGELEPLRDFMPDYMQIAQYETQNALTIFGLVSDIEKYLSLVDKFRIGIESPARVRVFEIKHVTPTQALEALRQLVEGFDQQPGAPATTRRGGQPSVGEAQAMGVIAIPSEDRGTLLIKAMPAKIAEIEKFLVYVDVPMLQDFTDPVIVRVEHADPGDVISLVQSVLDQGSNPNPAQPVPPRPRRGKRAAVQPQPDAPATTASLTDLSMVEWAPASAIILLGKPERIEEAKALIARFDVPDEVTRTTFVEVHNREADELVNVLTALTQSSMPGLVVTADVPSGRIALGGSPSDIAHATKLIETLDLPSAIPPSTIHSIRIANAAPSSLIPILTTWDSEGATTAAAQPQTPPQPAKPGRQRTPRRSRNVQGGNKFQADDATKMLHVICTDEEWTDKYEPIIKRLDDQLAPPVDQTLITLEHLTADEAIAQFEQVLPSTKNGAVNGPTYMSVPHGVLVSGASAGNMATLRGLLEQIDIDRKALEKHQIFEIKHADPQEVLTVVQAQYGDATAGAPPTPRRRGPQVVAATGTSWDVRFSLTGNRLFVWASAKQMEEIAALIAELDSDVGGKLMKAYVFEAGTDVTTLAQTLTQFFPDSGTVSQPAGATPGGRRSRRVAATGPGGSSVMFVPQPADWKIIVSAPAELFPEIEETIDMFRPDGSNSPELSVRIFPVPKGDPTILADMVSSVATLKLDEMIAKGTVRTVEGQTPALNITADPAGKRVIVASPAPLMPEIERLLEQFSDGAGDQSIVKRVVLKKVSALDMAQTVNAMLTGSGVSGGARTASAPQRPRGGRRSRGEQPPQPATASVTTATTALGVTVVPAPGDDALVLTGAPAEVEKVEGWIKQLDAEATGAKVMKAYTNLNVDVEKLADEIMNFFDSAPPAEKKKEESEDSWFDFDFDMASSGGPRRGAEISLTTDSYSGTMVVWAPPRIITQIDDYVAMYDKGTLTIREQPPSTFYDLQFATDAFDAKYALKKWVDVESWEGGKPEIDYVSGERTLIIRHQNPDEVERVKDLIVKYVDKPTKGNKEARRVKSIAGTPAELVAAMLEERLGGNVEVRGTTTTTPKQSYIDELKPEANRCVLPSMLRRALEDTTIAAVGQTTPAQNVNTNGAALDADAQKLLQDLLQKRAAQATQAPATQPATNATTNGAAAEEPPARPKLRIEVDPITNSIRFIGSPQDVADAEDTLEDIIKELGEGPKLPDIRVWVLKYIDPNVASQVIDTMFNGAPGGTNAQRQQQQAARQQQQLMNQLMKQQQAQQKNQQGGEKGGEGQPGGRGGRGREGEENREGGEKDAAEPQEPQQQLSGIQVFPYPPLHALILKAPTELYPAVEQLLATIDRKTSPGSEYRYFKIKSMLASEVEAQLKVIFGVDQPTSERGARANPRQGRNQPGVDPAAAAVQALLENTINLGVDGGESGSASTASIVITSNDASNTVLMRGPNQVLDMAEEIIADIEKQVPDPVLLQTFELKHADATTVVQQLKDLFAPAARAGGGGRRGGGEGASAGSIDDVNAVFVPDTGSNSIVVRCRQKELDKIQDAIARLDVPNPVGGKAETIELACGDAVGMAKLLEAIYATPKAGRGNQPSGKTVQFSGDATSNMIVFVAPTELRDEIRQHAAALEKSACASVLPKFITVEKAQAVGLAKVLEESFSGPKRGSGRVKVTGDDASGRLMVIAPPEMMPQIEKLAKELDVDNSIMDIQVFQLKFARAPEVLTKMKEMVTQLMAQIRGTSVRLDPFTASAEERTNSIIVMGGPATFALVKRVLDQIDVPGAQPFETKSLVMVLQKARAAEVVNTINNLFRDRKDGIEPPRAEATPTTNTLTVRGTEAQLKEIQDLVSKLETVDPSDRLAEATIALTHVKAEETAEYVRGWFDERVKAVRNMNPQGVKPSETTLAITPDTSANQIIVMANPENIEKIKTLVAGLDKEGAGIQQVRETKVYPLHHADPNAVSTATQSAFRPGKNPAEKDKVDVTIDSSTQALIVTASPINQDRVAKMVAELDKEAPQLNERRTHTLKNARAATVAQLLKQMIADTRGPTRQGRPPVSVLPNEDLNMLVLSGTKDDIDAIIPLIEELDVESSDLIHVVTLKNADPAAAAKSLQDMFARRGPGGETVSISNPAGTQTLLVKASGKDFADITEVVKQIDVLPTDENRQSKMFALKFVNADEMQTILEDALRVPGQAGQRGGQTTLLGDTRIAALPSSNALVVTGSLASIEKAEGLVAQLDVEMPDSGAQAKIIKLQKAIASAVEPTLTKLFVENSGAGARGSGRNNTAAQKPVIVADDATNSLIVRAAPADYNLIEKLAISLDEEGGDVSKRFKIIQVSSAYKVADIAGSLEETLRATAMPSGDGRNAQRNEVSVQAIPASNTLVLAGDPKQLAVAEALVKQLQEMGPPGGRKQLIINTKNMSAEEIKRVLDEMLEQNSGGTGSSGGRSQGSTPRRNSGGGRRPR